MPDPVVFLSRLGKFAFVPIGLLFLLAAAWTVSSTKAWIAHSFEVQGKVIDMARTRDSNNTGYLFAPVVRFQTVEGRTIDFESGLRSNSPTYRTGQTVSVLYDPDEPRSAAIRGVFSLWFMPIILGFIGSIFLIVGAAMVVISRWAATFFGGQSSSLDPAAGSRSASPSH